VQISAVIITKNEESNIADAIASLTFADEIIVVDSHSTDATAEIAKLSGAKVIVRDWPGFSEQKQFGVDACENDWVFSLDADERVSESLQAEIEFIRRRGVNADAYRLPRRTTYMHREIQHSGWYPDRQLRFFDRKAGQWNGREIHESVQMSKGSKIRDLKGHLLHFSVENALEHHKMIEERYAPLAAAHMYKNGQRTSALRVVLAGPTAFLRSYILRMGFMDGFPGFCIARFAAYHAYLKHLLLWEKLKDDPHK